MNMMITRICLISFLTVLQTLAWAQTNESSPLSIQGATSEVYRSIGGTDLRLHVFEPARDTPSPRAAIVLFFGGGWNKGTVMQFVPHARYFAERGMVAIVADYRVKTRHGVTPFECVSDAKAAMRWVRQHAADFHIDPSRIVAAGGSAGGHLALCTAVIPDRETDETTVSAAPNALVLFNPVVDMTKMRIAKDTTGVASPWPARAEEISPAHHVRRGLPPALIFHGTNDTIVPFELISSFSEAWKQQGNECEVVAFEGRQHAFFNVGKNDGVDYRTTLDRADAFLTRYGFLTKSPDK